MVICHSRVKHTYPRYSLLTYIPSSPVLFSCFSLNVPFSTPSGSIQVALGLTCKEQYCLQITCSMVFHFHTLHPPAYPWPDWKGTDLGPIPSRVWQLWRTLLSRQHWSSPYFPCIRTSPSLVEHTCLVLLSYSCTSISLP